VRWRTRLSLVGSDSSVGDGGDPVLRENRRGPQQVEQVVGSAVQHPVDEVAQGYDPLAHPARTRRVASRERLEKGDEAAG
jgi:hypothetical protein